MRKKDKIVISILSVLVFPIFFLASVIVIDSFVHPNNIPSFFGWKPLVVFSNNLAPVMKKGDLIIIKNESPKNEGDIISYWEGEFIFTEKINKIINENNNTKYAIRYDYLEEPYESIVLESKVEGVYKYTIKGVGNVVVFLQTPLGIIICLSIPVLYILLAKGLKKINKKIN